MLVILPSPFEEVYKLPREGGRELAIYLLFVFLLEVPTIFMFEIIG